MDVTNKNQNAPEFSYGGKTEKKMDTFTFLSLNKVRGLLIMLSLSFFIQQSQAVEIEARTGLSYGHVWGLHTGAYVNFPQSKLFSIQTGLLLQTAGRPISGTYSDFKLNVFAPVYASFHLPVGEKAKMRLNAGAFIGTGYKFHAGATAEVGVEINRFYVGVNCFQSCVDPEDTQLGWTVGYSFSLFRKKN